MDLIKAKCDALGHYTKEENKSVFVLYPGAALFINNSLEVMEEYAERTKKTIVIVKLDGKIVSDSKKEIDVNTDADTSVEAAVTKKTKKK